jgi:copper(I)-binding protein
MRLTIGKALVATALTLAAGSGPVLAQEYRAGSLLIEQPWSRATPAGAKVGAGYVVIRNAGPSPDRLLGASAEVAGRVEIHEMVVDNDVARMRPRPNGLEIRPGATAELKPGGLHLMMMDLKRPLVQGETVRGTLTFEQAGAVAVEFKVQSIGAPAPAQAGHAPAQAGHAH